jgi:hypothetical protein
VSENPSAPTLERRRVLLLASYCGPDERGCTDALPCPACLTMCNVADVSISNEATSVAGGWEYLRSLKKLRVLRREPRRRRYREP